ncbi:MAG TPA: methylated-DNA--[protein]-cysteine S-methyltransferase [Polyangiaceae bacterium]|nr:methylated-DNA--[protein]-cysteine S-methyltransferase [Polyangiaceae bacterium]
MTSSTRPKRNKPSLAQQHARQVAELCRFIEQAERTPTLRELATRARLSTFHLLRVFKAVTGLTPKAYAAAQSARRVANGLSTRANRSRSPVTQALYGAGYGSSGRFYEHSNARLGMTPTRLRKGGVGVTIQFAVGECSLGSILVALSGRGVCAITLGDDPDALSKDLQRRFPRADLRPGDRRFNSVIAKVIGFVEAPRRGIDLPLDIRGTAFQERVWRELRKIPPGQTRSYAEIAQRIGAPTAYRAVARACAQNPIAVVIPCHRVVRTDGNLSGYRWGIQRKRQLLEREGAQ